MQVFITTTDGKAGVTIDGNTLGITEKNQFGGTNQAYATLSRSELEQIRDAITEELARTA